MKIGSARHHLPLITYLAVERAIALFEPLSVSPVMAAPRWEGALGCNDHLLYHRASNGRTLKPRLIFIGTPIVSTNARPLALRSA